MMKGKEERQSDLIQEWFLVMPIQEVLTNVISMLLQDTFKDISFDRNMKGNLHPEPKTIK